MAIRRTVGSADRWSDSRRRPVPVARDLVDRALTAISRAMASDTGRRNFTCINPAPDISGTTRTLVMGMQITLPGEIAWAHRHSIREGIWGHVVADTALAIGVIAGAADRHHHCLRLGKKLAAESTALAADA